jgi:PKD repeat protein
MISGLAMGADLEDAFDTFTTGSDESQGDVQETDCASLDESMAAAMGCSSSTDIIDFMDLGSNGIEAPDPSGYDPKLTENTNAREFIQSIVNYALSFLGLIAVVMVIYGGIMYVASHGEEDMAGKGKKAITYSVIGIVIILASYALVNTLLSAGGGTTGDNGNGTATTGETITETGAAFDVESVLKEIEDLTVDYRTVYNTYMTVGEETAYLQSIEMPLIVSVITEDLTLSGLADWFSEKAARTDSEFSDEYTLISQQQIEDYVSDLRKGIQNIQSIADPYSETYERSQKLYDYLRSGATDFSFIETSMEWLSAYLMPSANAVQSTLDETGAHSGTSVDPSTVSPETPESTEGDDPDSSQSDGESEDSDVSDVKANATSTTTTVTKEQYDAEDFGPACASFETAEDTYVDSQWLFGIPGATVSETTVSEIDDYICPALTDIMTAAGKDYQEQVTTLIARFDELALLFDTKDNAAFDSGSKLTTIIGQIEAARGLLTTAQTTIQASTVRNIVTAMNTLHESVATVQFVKVRLTASAVEGNAPLVVNFTALGTEDPSGKTVEDERIQWDLDGDNDFNNQTLGGLSGPEPTGAAVTATYTEAGTYRAKVRVLSSDENIAAGIATVPIEVSPTRSIIILKAIMGSDETTIANYDSTPKIDRDSYKMTITEGSSGVWFDATETMDGNRVKDGLFFEWDFGDNNTLMGNASEAGRVSHSYAKNGMYNVSLAITDKTGVQDHKYFTVYVGTLAARMSYTPTSGPIGTEFNFDGTASSVDNGSIVSYQWSATKDGKNVNLDNNKGSTLKTKLSEPGIYIVTLTVADDSGKTDSVYASILVDSTPPVATYNYSTVNENDPAVIMFDASDSYDPDKNDTISYSWDFDGAEGKDYKIINSDNGSKTVTVEFLKVGDYDVVLTVKDQYEGDLQKEDTATATISIKSVLSVNLTIEGDGARHLDANGEVSVEITGESKNSTSLEISYGDGGTDFADFSTEKKVFTHTYKQAGIFYVTLTAYNDETNESISVTRRVYIGAGDMPIAVIDVSSDGSDIGFGSTVMGSVDTRFTFNAEKSVNVDGSANNLAYGWNFGDGATSTQKSVTHTFDERNTYTVTLTVKDKTDNAITASSTVQVQITNIAPRIRGITITPQNTTMLTPLNVNVAVDAIDTDGKVNYMKAWYYDLNDTAEQLGMVISRSPTFILKINTKGEEGDTKEYGFAVEVTDDNNLTVSSVDTMSEDEIPTLEVTNGPNKSPVASFTVNKTSIFVGDEVTFSSTSYDPDGSIVRYWWDIEGDGFYNNDPQTTSSYVYKFTQVHRDGLQVKLKVEDSSGATAESNPVTVYVESVATPPDAKFLTDINGTTVSFKNNSDFDTENGSVLSGTYWDFDLNADSDGNGIKDDDIDSLEASPSYTYPTLGTYKAKMTIVDNLGQSDSVSQDVQVMATGNPVADFTYSEDDKKVSFKDVSTADAINSVTIRSYEWDFDLKTDSDGNGNAQDDKDSMERNAAYEYKDYGTYEVKLTVTDSMGKVANITKQVEVASPIAAVEAYLTSVPTANSQKQVILTSDGQEVTFYFNGEGGSENYTYTLDKNIFYDTDGNGIRDDDKDYTADAAGKWKTPFYKSYGQTVTKLTVTDDEMGDAATATLQIVFQGSTGGANLFNVTPSEMLLILISTMLTAIFGVSMVFTYKPLPKR